MGQNNDYTFDMSDEPLSEQQIEQLLQGKIDPLQASGALAHLANLISNAKMAATVEELATENTVLQNFKQALGKAPVRSIDHQAERRLRSNFMPAKVAGVLIAATALTGTAVAAYHGDLPRTFQTPLSSGLAKVGISVPNTSDSGSRSRSSNVTLPNQTSSNSSGTSGSRNDVINGTDNGLASGNSLLGLCTAFVESTSSNSVNSTTTTDGTTTTSSVTTTTAAATTTTKVTSGFTHSVEYQRLQIAAKQKGETVAQLCSNNNLPANRHAPDSTSVAGKSIKGQNGNSHSLFFSSTTTTVAGSNPTPEYQSSNSRISNNLGSGSVNSFSRIVGDNGLGNTNHTNH
ncbi:MAG: hypothetical protein HKL84_00115 [Acidimicrobiaceae bacterium]|nr:hypothetical protein [Acidimicrobiaceae bacterium]